MPIIQGFTVNLIQDNTYIVSYSTGEAAFFDFGALFPVCLFYPSPRPRDS